MKRLACSLLGFVLVGGSAHAKEWNVLDGGAVADAATDCTGVFQKALDAAGADGGGIVNVPAGHYRIDGRLSIPGGVTLQGVFRGPPTDQREGRPKLDGSVLLAYAGRGSREGEPFIRFAGSNSTLAGFMISYPEWKIADVPPVPYPPTVASSVVNNAILDCCFLNSYEAIHFQNAARFLVRNVYGYPSARGLWVDNCLDIGRVENCHFWPFGVAYTPDHPYCKWINTQGVAFEFARTDWQYVTNTFCFGYGVGYKFSGTQNGSCNGNFLGIGADCCVRPVLVEQSQYPGLLITNGEFVGRWGSQDSVGVEIAPGAGEGKVSLNNCSFWGPIDRCIWSRSPWVQLTAIGTNFCQWDLAGKNSPAIQIDAGKAIVQGNTFGDGDTHVAVGAKVRSAIIMGNQATGGFRVRNEAGGRTQSLANEQDALSMDASARSHYRLDLGVPGDRAYVRECFGAEHMPIGDRSDTTMRWSTGNTELRLPVVPGKPYTLTVDMHVPEACLDADNGLYLGERRLAELPAKAHTGPVRIALPPSDGDQLRLTLRVKAWCPQKLIPGSQDHRLLGVALFSLAMQADGAAGEPATVNAP